MTIKGLRTQENEKFKNFFNIVQTEARRQGKAFFLEAGDGNSFESGTLEGEDLQGWLIDNSEVAEFELYWEREEIPDRWSDNFTFAIWSKDGETITIEFRSLD